MPREQLRTVLDSIDRALLVAQHAATIANQASVAFAEEAKNLSDIGLAVRRTMDKF